LPTFCVRTRLSLFGAHGEEIEPSPVPDDLILADGDAYPAREPGEYRRKYRDQVLYLAQQVETMVARILENSSRTPIIILQGDHGPGSRLFREDPARSDLRERLSILNACYFPGAGRKRLYETITPVNTFRVLLNGYFGARLSLLADRNYFAKWSAPYAFQDVTSRLPHSTPAGEHLDAGPVTGHRSG
jgi:hypothetical protein